jgi:hypothetical protein
LHLRRHEIRATGLLSLGEKGTRQTLSNDADQSMDTYEDLEREQSQTFESDVELLELRVLARLDHLLSKIPDGIQSLYPILLLVTEATQ